VYVVVGGIVIATLAATLDRVKYVTNITLNLLAAVFCLQYIL